MKKSDMIVEASLVDLDDHALKEFMGYLHESVKTLTEEMKKDPDIKQMEQTLKDYKKDNYQDEIKTYNAKLKAARAQAHARGIKWIPPQE
jgi:hypothetical protein